MKDKKKPSLAILIGMKPKKGDMSADEDGKDMGDKGEGDEGEDSPHLDAAHGILDAVKSNDAEQLAEALKVFYDICKEEHSEGDEGY